MGACSTWRKLPQEKRDSIDEASAIQIMMEIPTIIKRPVLIQGKEVLVGFDEERYLAL